MPSKALGSENKGEYREGTSSLGTGGLCVFNNPNNGMFSVIQLKGEGVKAVTSVCQSEGRGSNFEVACEGAIVNSPAKCGGKKDIPGRGGKKEKHAW